jgi:hypothetical protein
MRHVASYDPHNIHPRHLSAVRWPSPVNIYQMVWSTSLAISIMTDLYDKLFGCLCSRKIYQCTRKQGEEESGGHILWYLKAMCTGPNALANIPATEVLNSAVSVPMSSCIASVGRAWSQRAANNNLKTNLKHRLELNGKHHWIAGSMHAASTSRAIRRNVTDNTNGKMGVLTESHGAWQSLSGMQKKRLTLILHHYQWPPIPALQFHSGDDARRAGCMRLKKENVKVD